VDDLVDDEGFSALIGASPDMVQVVPVAGGMPDVDRPEDLELARTLHLTAETPDVSTAR
jgi:CTP:molybdopterin cytidylyltransferase MocA